MSNDPADRPHVIWLHSDQHRASMMGCVPDSWVRTPNLDRLAAAGRRFNAAYCASPLCGPSRMAMLTGRMPARIGVETNSDALGSHIPTVAHALGAGGYHTVLCGRMHFIGPDQRHGFVERLVGDHSPTDVAMREHPMGPFDGTTGQDAKGLVVSGPGESTVTQYDRDVTDAACRRIRDHDPDRPLFLSVGWYGPHNPFVCPPDLFEHYRRVTPPVTDQQRRRFRDEAHPAMRAWLAARGLDELDSAVAHRARVAYSGLVEFLDQQVGRIMHAVGERFDPAEVVIVYTSDHGEMSGEKGMFWKSNFYEGSVAVPWIFHAPGRIVPGVTSQPVSMLDLPATLAELTGSRSLPETDGLALAAHLTREQPLPDRPIVSTLADARGRTASAMIRHGRYKLVRHHGHDVPQLFDLQNDPEEWTDLAADSQYADTRADLEERLAAAWDPERSMTATQRARERLSLLREWAQQQGVPHHEHWQADLTRLHLDPTPASRSDRHAPR